MFKKNINTVLVSTITVAVLLAVVAIVAYVSRSSYEQTLALQQQSMRHIGAATHTALNRYMAGHEALVRTLATQQAILEAFDGQPERARERLREYIKANPDYRTMFLFDAKGSIIAGYNAEGQDLSGQSRADRDYVRAIAQGQDTYFGQEILSAKSSGAADLTFPVVLAVKGAGGVVKGGIGVFPKWEVFTQAFIDPPRFGTRGYAYMLDATGKVIAHAMDKNLLLQDFNGSDFIRQTLNQKNGELFYDWKGERKYQSFFTDPETGWTLCLNAYVDDLTETATLQRNILLGIGTGAVLLLAMIVVVVVNRLVVRPIHNIEAFTSAIALGDFSAE
ncbi:MAG: hypothetical protein EOL86_15215, partial [Deltaproteobacteria bacterium]|nr:hypothetical protein [Deltaproteobacteria bacterium]